MSFSFASVSFANNLAGASRSLSASFERLSSGSRVQRVGDDAAGLAVAENLDAVNRSVRQAIRNTNDGIAMATVFDAATDEVGNILTRMRELAVMATSGTMTTAARTAANDEFANLITLLDDIDADTSYGGVDFDSGSVDIQVGHTTANQVAVTIEAVDATSLAVNALDLADATNAAAAITSLDTAIDSVAGYRAGYGAAVNTLDSALSYLEGYSSSLTTAFNTINDVDTAYESANMAKQQILMQSSIAMLSQAGQTSSLMLSLL